MTDANRTKCTVYVTGLDASVDPLVLHSAFLPFGDIVDVNLPSENDRRRDPSIATTVAHRGFGYVEYETPEDAAAAIDNMDQAELYGRVIKVAPAKATREKGEGLGSKFAVWEQEGWLAKNEVSEEDRMAAEKAEFISKVPDPMEGLEGLDVAGPKPQT